MASPVNIQDYLVTCTVRVGSGQTGGTGFFIAPGLVLTCAHLVEDAENDGYPLTDVSVFWHGSRYPGRVIRYAASPDPNIAVLSVEVDEPPCAFLLESIRDDDALYVCGFADESEGPGARLLLEGVRQAGSNLTFESDRAAPSLGGAPVLNLRTGGVCAILNSRPQTEAASTVRAISVSRVGNLFPEVRAIHDRYHEEVPRWFDCTGIAGTVFAARSHLAALKAAVERPGQSLLAPKGGMNVMKRMSPARFQVLSSRSGVATGKTVSIEDLMVRIRRDRHSLLVVGQAGSGRSSLLGTIAHTAVASFRNLAGGTGDCLFPILLKASQLAALEGSPEDLILGAMRTRGGLESDAGFSSRFLTDLTELPHLRLLILLDGVDEIQNARELASLVGVIGRIQEDPAIGSSTQLVLSSRPSSAEHFRYSDVDIYELLPLEVESIEETARLWLGDDYGRFLKQNRGLFESGLLSSPLVLSVALSLFERAGKKLPNQVVALYRNLVSECVEDWKDRKLDRTYGATALKDAIDVLGFLALELIRSAALLDSRWLTEALERYYTQHRERTKADAAGAAERFSAFAESDSFFLSKEGEHYYWSHRSFRDYLAASWLVKSHSNPEGAAREIRGRWFDANWGRTPAFAIQMLPNASEQISIVREILSSGRDSRLDFVAGLVRDGAVLPKDVIDRLIEGLLSSVAVEQASYGVEPVPQSGGVFGFDVLLSLHHLAAAREAIERIAADTVGNSTMREAARERLAPVAG